jgi:hypothetical protein
VFYSNCHYFVSKSWRLIFSFIDSILRVLLDGSWHSIKEVLEYLGDSEVKTVMTIRFLWRFGFVDVDENENQVKLSSPMFKFMSEIEAI